MLTVYSAEPKGVNVNERDESAEKDLRREGLCVV
jgi:hypothetical protein